MIQQTSLMSYNQIQPKIGKRQQEVLDLLIKYKDNYLGLTDYEIANLLGQKDPNYVRPRRNELAKQGLIKNKGKRTCTITKRKAIIWGVV